MSETTKTGSKKNRVLAILLLAALAIAAVGGAYAYFTATTQTQRNTFTIVEGGGDENVGNIDEPDWDPDDPSHWQLQPNEIVNKNPSYVHQADWEALVFMTVTVPVVEQTDVDADNMQVKQATLTAGFPLVLINHEWNINYINALTDQVKGNLSPLKGDSSKWALIGCDTSDPTKLQYLFGYKDVVKKGDRTESCFDRFQVLNFNKYYNPDNNTQDNPLNCDVQCHVIQKEGYDGATLAVFKEVFPTEGANFNNYSAPTVSIAGTDFDQTGGGTSQGGGSQTTTPTESEDSGEAGEEITVVLDFTTVVPQADRTYHDGQMAKEVVYYVGTNRHAVDVQGDKADGNYWGGIVNLTLTGYETFADVEFKFEYDGNTYSKWTVDGTEVTADTALTDGMRFTAVDSAD